MAQIQDMRRGVNTFARALMGASGVLLVLLCPETASAVECEWNGSVSADWSNGANWDAGCGAGGPVNGDSVVFENGAANAVTNNPTANLQLVGLLMSGVGAGNVPYQIGGSAIVLNGNIAVNTGGLPAPQITAPLVLGTNVQVALNGAGTMAINALDLNGFDIVFDVVTNTATLRLQGLLSGNGGITKQGGGAIWLIQANTFSGILSVNAGVAQVLDPNALGASGAGNQTVVADGSEIIINFLANATVPESFTLSGDGVANVGVLRADGPQFTISGPISTPAVAAIGVPLDHVLTFSGLVSGAGLRKLSGGTLVLTGANTHGNSAVEAGSLIVNGNQPTSSVNVLAGLFGGIGVTDQVTGTGGTMAPGLSPGIITTGNLNLNGATTLLVEMDGPAVGTGYDQTNVMGSVTLGNAILDIALTFAPAEGAEFVIINNDGGDPVAGAFAGLAQGAIVNLDGQPFHVNYQGGDGNDVVLSFAPNGVPTMPVIVFIALASLLAALVISRLHRPLVRA